MSKSPFWIGRECTDCSLSFYTLAAQPEISAMLKEEVEEVLSNNGGEFTSQALQDMKKLDSFLRELLRYYPLQACK